MDFDYQATEMEAEPQGLLRFSGRLENLEGGLASPTGHAFSKHGCPEGTHRVAASASSVTERRGMEAPCRFSSHFARVPGQDITGPKFFFPEAETHGDEPGDVVFPLGENYESRKTHQDRAVAAADRHEIRCGSWNLAGTCAKRVKTLLSEMPDCDVMAVQEYPKQAAGWRILKGEVYHGALYQDHLMYRAVGLFYNATKFNLYRKHSSQRGAWFLLQHKVTQKFVWFGTLHLPNSEPREELSRNMTAGFDKKCHKGYPAILLGDFNIQFNWVEQSAEIVPGVIGPKWAELRQKAAEAGFHQLHPPLTQLSTPTFHSRKGNVANTQIDGAFGNLATATCLEIMEQSRHEIGTDHDRVEMTLVIKGEAVKRVRAGGPRVLCRDLPQMTRITQQRLEQIAQTCTKPASLGPKFVASEAVKTLGQMARFSRSAGDWKIYLSALRKEKTTWKGERLEQASQNWGLYKALTKKKKAWGDDYMARAREEDPVSSISHHFDRVFHDNEVEGVREQLEEVTRGITDL